jgi:hypothetical protein
VPLTEQSPTRDRCAHMCQYLLGKYSHVSNHERAQLQDAQLQSRHAWL